MNNKDILNCEKITIFTTDNFKLCGKPIEIVDNMWLRLNDRRDGDVLVKIREIKQIMLGLKHEEEYNGITTHKLQ